MPQLLLIGWLGALASVWGWQLFLEPMGLPSFPIGALAVLPLLYFSWRETLLWILTLGLISEATLPIDFGSVTIPLIVGTLLLQLLGRHQLRANSLTRFIAALLLQLIVEITLCLIWPPRTLAGLISQLWGATGTLIAAAALAALGTWFFVWIAEKRFALNLDSRLKDL